MGGGGGGGGGPRTCCPLAIAVAVDRIKASSVMGMQWAGERDVGHRTATRQQGAKNLDKGRREGYMGGGEAGGEGGRGWQWSFK